MAQRTGNAARVEYMTVSNDRGDRSLAARMNEAAVDGWRFSATLHATYWGSDQRLGLVVLMERELNGT